MCIIINNTMHGKPRLAQRLYHSRAILASQQIPVLPPPPTKQNTNHRQYNLANSTDSPSLYQPFSMLSPAIHLVPVLPSIANVQAAASHPPLHRPVAPWSRNATPAHGGQHPTCSQPKGRTLTQIPRPQSHCISLDVRRHVPLHFRLVHPPALGASAACREE